MMMRRPGVWFKYFRYWLLGTVMIAVVVACGGDVTTTPAPPRTPTEEIIDGFPSATPEKKVQPTPLDDDTPVPVTATDDSTDEPLPTPDTGTISGRVEFSGGLSTEPLADTIVEVAGWEDVYFTVTNAQGEYSITDVPPGVQMVIPRSNMGLTSYQSVNVVAGQIAVANFSILSAFPFTQTATIDVTIRVDGDPVSDAYLWVARSKDVYQSDQNGNLSFVYGSSVGSPVVVVAEDRWDILAVEPEGEQWDIELSRAGDPPPLPEGRNLILEPEPVLVEAILPTPFMLTILPGLETQEDCIKFNGAKAQLQSVRGRWHIVVGDILLLDFGNNTDEAKQALAIIQHYGFNQQCFVGRPDPSMEYYLADGKAPSGRLENEDCIAFIPDTLKVETINKRWKITSGASILLDFDSEAEAQNVYKIIQKYAFTNQCFVGRPDPSLTYFHR